MRLMITCAMLTCLLAGCESKTVQEEKQQVIEESAKINEEMAKQGPHLSDKPVISTKSFAPFYVYKDISSRDNHYVPSGFMPNGKCLNFNDRWQDGCNAGKTCIRIDYDLACSRKDQRWAGIYWLNPPNNWGTRKGGFNLKGATKLTFWARGEDGGEQIEEFTVGGITGDYPDTDKAILGPVILSTEWKKYTIDLRGKDLSYISGGFAWSTNEEVNGETCIFYLDDIRYE